MLPDSLLSIGLTTWLGRAIVNPTPPPSAAVATAASASDGSMLLYLLGGGSLVTIIGMLGKGLSQLLSGRGAEQTRRDASLVVQRDTAWKERDEERQHKERAQRNFGRMQDYAGQLRYLCRVHGVPADEIPNFPEVERTPEDHSTH